MLFPRRVLEGIVAVTPHFPADVSEHSLISDTRPPVNGSELRHSAATLGADETAVKVESGVGVVAASE